MKKLTIRIDDELHKKLRHKLIDENKSVNAYVIDLIENDLNKEKMDD